MTFDLHNVLVGVISLVDQHVTGSGSDGNQVISLLVPC